MASAPFLDILQRRPHPHQISRARLGDLRLVTGLRKNHILRLVVPDHVHIPPGDNVVNGGNHPPLEFLSRNDVTSIPL